MNIDLNLKIKQNIANMLIQQGRSIDVSEYLFEQDCHYLIMEISQNENCRAKSSIINLYNEYVVNYRYNCYRNLFKYLYDHSIPYAVIKGAVLSYSIYQNPYWRISSDLDIIIEPTNVDGVKKYLEREGFFQGRIVNNQVKEYSRENILFYNFFSHQEAPYIKQTSNPMCPYISIDLNTNIMWGECNIQVNISDLLVDVECIEINGVMTNKLRRELEFIVLCLHHYKDINSLFLLFTKGIILSLFSDIYYFVKNNPMDTIVLEKYMNELSVGQYVYYCLHYTNLLFCDDQINLLMELFSHYCDPLLLESYGLNNDERKKWRISFFERMNRYHLKKYLTENLDTKDFEKIQQNMKYL